MVEHELHCFNRGQKPSFVTSNRRERLDISVVSTDILSEVKFWKVLDTESMSDHRYVQFGLDLGRPDPIFYRNRRKTNWGDYALEVTSKLAEVPVVRISSYAELEERVTAISAILRNAYETACPLKKVRTNGRTVPSWTTELSQLRLEAPKAYRRTTAGCVDDNWRIYCEKRNSFKRVLRKAKRSSWREYCGSVEELFEAARLYHVLKSDTTITLGPLEHSNESYTSGIGESLEMLLEKHFPDDPNQALESPSHQYSLPDDEVDSVISLEKVKRAVKSFGSYKSADWDGVFPAMLHYGPSSLLHQLTCVIRACLCLGYTPKDWLVMKIVFIPKPGKDSYERVSFWRPISLTSFWLKTMERLIDWHIRTPVLIGGLKSAGQYAYMSGVSTEAALHQVVARMERTLKSGEFGISTTLEYRSVDVLLGKNGDFVLIFVFGYILQWSGRGSSMVLWSGYPQ